MSRLKGILLEIIGPTQSAFVTGRFIIDNVLIAYECMNTIKSKKGKSGLCELKLDMHTMYDRVEWCFLK